MLQCFGVVPPENGPNELNAMRLALQENSSTTWDLALNRGVFLARSGIIAIAGTGTV